MKSTRALKATGLVLIAIVLGMLTVQGSYALWNTAATASAGTVQAADFRISLRDTVTSTVTDMTLANGTSATLKLSTTALGTVNPGHSIYAGVEVGNVTNAGGDFTVRANTGAPVIGGNAGSPLTPFLKLKAVAASSLSQCNQAALYAQADPSGTSAMNIVKEASGVFCFEVTLASTMPANLSGQSAEVAIPIIVNQL